MSSIHTNAPAASHSLDRASRAGGRGAMIFAGLLVLAASNLLAAWWRPIGRFAPSGTDCVVDTVTGRKYFVGSGGISSQSGLSPLQLSGE